MILALSFGMNANSTCPIQAGPDICVTNIVECTESPTGLCTEAQCEAPQPDHDPSPQDIPCKND